MLECRIKSNLSMLLYRSLHQCLEFMDMQVRSENILNTILAMSSLMTLSWQVMKRVMIPWNYFIEHTSAVLWNSYDSVLIQCSRHGI